MADRILERAGSDDEGRAGEAQAEQRGVETENPDHEGERGDNVEEDDLVANAPLGWALPETVDDHDRGDGDRDRDE